METSKNSSNIRSLMYSGKHALLPPKIPFPTTSSSYSEYAQSSGIGSKVIQKPRGGNTHHQRTSSETCLLEEQPSWLEDLLNEPETPVSRGGHRRSSSDSLAYVDIGNVSTTDYATQDNYRFRNVKPVPSAGSQQFDYLKETRKPSAYAEARLTKQRNRAWGSSLTTAAHLSGLTSAKETAVLQSSGSSCAKLETDEVSYSMKEKQDTVEPNPHDLNATPERKDGSAPKSSTSEIDTKRAKQQFAQRSRVRKLQYIAELERKVQALQAEGSEVSAELEFLNQQSFILSMENKAFKHRLENLAQEQLIKLLEQGVLEKEIGRLRTLYQQQQQQRQNQQQSSSSLRLSSSGNLDSQFAKLLLKHKNANSSNDPLSAHSAFS